MEELLIKLNDTITDLVVNHNVPHKTIKTEIFNTIQNISNNLPKFKILYNEVHGGFGYSKKFKEFLNVDEYYYPSNNERIEHVNSIALFGKECKQQYPFITKLVNLYNKYKFKDVFSHLANIKILEDLIIKTNNILEVVEKHNTFGSETEIEHIYINSFDINKVEKYTKESIITWLNVNKTKNIDKLKGYHKFIENIIGDYSFIKSNQDIIFQEEIADNELPWYSRKKWDEKSHKRLCFPDSITEYGENHFAIWKCQDYYNEKSMRFLLKYHELYDYSGDYCSDTEIGLLFASGPYCKLNIYDVPQLLDWYIGEYDGKESIVIKP